MLQQYRRTVRLHTGAWLLTGLVRGGLLQQLGFLIGKLGGSPALVVLGTTAPLSVLLLSYLIIPWGERYQSRRLVAGSVTLGAVLFFPMALDLSPLWIALLAFVAVAISAFGQVFYGRLLSGMYPPDRRGRLSSVPLFFRAAGAVAASLLAGWLLNTRADAHLWLFPTLAMGAVAAGVMIWRLPEGHGTKRQPNRAPLREAVREALTNRPYVVWALIYSFINVGYWLSHAARPVYYAGVLELSYLQNGTALAFFNVCYGLGLLVWGRLIDRIGAVPTLVASWIAIGGGLLLVVVTPGYPFLLIGEALIGLGMAGNELARILAVLEFAPGDSVDRYMGLFMSLFGVRATLGSLLGLVLMGWSATGSGSALVVAATIVIAGSLAMLWVRMHWKQGRQHG